MTYYKPLLKLERENEPSFFEPVWTRTWTHRANDPLKFESELREVQACSGFGVSDPYQIELGANSLSTLTVGNGSTLQEELLTEQTMRRDEAWLRSLGEDLCLGLLRLHQGTEQYHGAIYPFNVRVSEDGVASLWSVPSIDLEATPLTPSPRPPSYPVGKTWLGRAVHRANSRARRNRTAKVPTNTITSQTGFPSPDEPKLNFLSDIYAIGALLYHMITSGTGRENLPLAEGNLKSIVDSGYSENLERIVLKCLEPDPLDRFLGPAKLAEALNPETRAVELHIKRAQELTRKGLQHFRDGALGQALEFFEEAKGKDWLSVATWNNIAVVQARNQQWLEAIHSLEKAYKFSTTHPKISGNIAHCLLALGDHEAVKFWSNQVHKINPWLLRPHLTLNELNLREQRQSLAFYQARAAVDDNPKSHLARECLARTFEAREETERARHQREVARDLPQLPPLTDCLIDEDQETPWIIVRKDASDDSGRDGGSQVPRDPYDPKPSRSATKPHRDFPGESH